jgi:hypothetical protein
LGLKKTAKVETLQEILDEISEGSQVAATISRRLQTGYNILERYPREYGKIKDKNQKAQAPDHGLEYRPASSISP